MTPIYEDQKYLTYSIGVLYLGLLRASPYSYQPNQRYITMIQSTSNKKQPCITHNIYKLTALSAYLHSLTINGIEGMRVGYNVVARNGVYAATTEYFAGELPKLFIISNQADLYHTREHNKLPDMRYPHTPLGLHTPKNHKRED